MRLRFTVLILLASIAFPSCSSLDSGVSSEDLPSISGSARRPVDNLPRTEFPFDEGGNYVASWAAEGDRKYAARRPASTRSRTTSASRTTRSASSARAPAKPTTRRHVVRRGDTLWSLSRRYGTSVAAIKRANGLRSDTIRDGQSLVIP